MRNQQKRRNNFHEEQEIRNRKFLQTFEENQNQDKIVIHKILKAKTEGQKEYIKAIKNNQVIYSTGPAGTGKTMIAVALAAQYFAAGQIEKIVLTRPIVSAGNKKLGALPGEKSDKIMPYLVPLVEELKNYIGHSQFNAAIHQEAIIAEPLELMRGRNFHNAFIILDEAQNCSKDEIVMLVTRMGENSKVCITGDIEQSDIKNHDGSSDFHNVIMRTRNIKGFEHVELTDDDIVRNPLIKDFLIAMRN